MPIALTNGRMGGFASPSLTQPVVVSNVVGSGAYPAEAFTYPQLSVIVAPPLGPVQYAAAASDTALAFGSDTASVAVSRSVVPVTALVVADGGVAESVAYRLVDTSALSVTADSAVPVKRAAPSMSDTAVAVSESVAPVAVRRTSDVAFTASDGLPRATAARAVSESALAVFAATSIVVPRGTSDASLAVSAAVAVQGPTRTPADTALSVSVSVAVLKVLPPSDPLALSLSAVLKKTVATKVASDTAVALSDSAVAAVRHSAVNVSAADTALAVVASAARAVAYSAVDAALVGGVSAPSGSLAPSATLAPGSSGGVSSTLVVAPIHAVAESDTALVLASSLIRKPIRRPVDTGLAVTEVLRLAKVAQTVDNVLGKGLAPAASLAPSATLKPLAAVTETLTPSRLRVDSTSDTALGVADSAALLFAGGIGEVALVIASVISTGHDRVPPRRGTVTVTSSVTGKVELDATLLQVAAATSRVRGSTTVADEDTDSVTVGSSASGGVLLTVA